MIRLRPMTQNDIPAGLSLCRAAGWNQLPRDWELFLQMSPGGCWVAVQDDEGKVVGTVTTVNYESHFNWIGMVLVDPAKQRQGIGMRLLKESLHILQHEETVKLDATPAGREVYLKLNFVDEYRLTRMHCTTVDSSKLALSHASPVRLDDFAQVLEFDREVFGADRKAVLEWIWKGAPEYAFLVKEENHIKGYCFGRPGHNFAYIGPVIATDFKNAASLISAALQNCSGKAVAMDVLHHTPELMSWLFSIGFVEQRRLTRMYRGTNSWPGVPEKQFAILGPEFG